jgi:poly-gamma-glutamate synthesis protein (capsule biosynthesis protein)
VNFETVVNDGTCRPAAWSGGTWSSMDPSVLPDFFAYGFNGCGCANNHSLDYSKEGLFMTIAALDKAGIPHCGTGKDLQAASAPTFIDSPNGRVAFISVNTAFHPDARAGLTTKLSPGRPGMNAPRNKQKFFVTPEHLATLKKIAEATKVNGSRALNQAAGFTAPDAPGTFYFGGNVFQAAEKEGRTSWCDPNDLKRLMSDIAAARAKADAVVVLAHCHGIRADKYWEPDYYFEEFCRAAIDSGAAAVFGGGTHQLKGIELRKGCPIFYSLGDFVFQNSVTPSVPPDFCEQYGVPLDSPAKVAHNARSKGGKVGLHTDRANFLSVIPKVEVVNGMVKRVTMMPIELHFAHDWSVNGLPRPADEKASADIEKALARLSAEFGTEIVRLPGGILEARPRAK